MSIEREAFIKLLTKRLQEKFPSMPSGRISDVSSEYNAKKRKYDPNIHTYIHPVT